VRFLPTGSRLYQTWQSQYYRAGDDMADTSNNIHQLKKAAQYQVKRDFTDFYKNEFRQGELLTFIEYHFLPYHGGYTFAFEERHLYLQEQENANILDSLGDYLGLVRK
jgi:hypothetical protein